MIKLIICDMDGVLRDCKELHYEAFNEALRSVDPKYVISKEEHLLKYDGLSTRKKLQLVTADKGFPEDKHDLIWDLKQKTTIDIIKTFTPEESVVSVIRKLKEDGYTIAVASNSIRETVKMILLKCGFMEYVDYFVSNQDVKFPKPNTEIYLNCMIKSNVSPKETLIIEDSYVGRKGANDSGAFVYGVKNTKDMIYEDIKSFIDHIDRTKKNMKWQGGKMKVLIPMAGAGSRFEKAGYSFPKPLIPVKNMNDKPMIQVVVENINIESEHIYIVRKDHHEKYKLDQFLNHITPNCKIVVIDKVTEGAACTTLLAKEYINNNEPLLIANSDQFVEWNSGEFLYSMMGDIVDGGILTFTNSHPKWSYVKMDENGFVLEVREKEVISDEATVGIYYWTRGSDYVKYAEQMIQKNIRVNNEFFVAPVYNEAIQDGLKIKTFRVNTMAGLGTPEDLEYFVKNYK